MKKYIVSAALGVCVILPAVAMAEPMESFKEKISYSMGYEVGSYFKQAGDEIEKELLIKGIEDAFDGTDPAMSAEAMVEAKKEFAMKMQQAKMAEIEEMTAKNLAEGKAFVEENAKKKGVVVTESGLQYEVLKEGSGEKATATDTVKVEYVGTLLNGAEFDSSIKRGEPAEFEVGKVIKGWSEALQLMNPGTKLRLVIPPDLAYGEKGAAPMIQPNSTLLFEVELLEIVKAKE